MTPFKVDRSSIRRFLLEKQSLLPKTKNPLSLDSVEALVKSLECVQLDPVSVVEKNQHLVLAARQKHYQPKLLNQLLSEGKVFEYWANAMCAIPISDFPLFKPIRNLRHSRVKEELEKMDNVVKRIKDRLEKEGPLPSRAFKSETKVHGYWDNQAPKTKETSYALNLLLDSGIIRVVERAGNERFFGLTERTLPKALLEQNQLIDNETAQKGLIDKYLRAYRVIDPRDMRFGWLKLSASERREEVERRVKQGTLVALEIEDVNRNYYILEEDLERLTEIVYENVKSSRKTISFLPPLDNLLWSRERIVAFFNFDYKWEIYIPPTKRRYGPYAMPILQGDQFIGRINPVIDRKNNQLKVSLLQLEPFINYTKSLKNQLQTALNAFARFHSVQEIDINEIPFLKS